MSVLDLPDVKAYLRIKSDEYDVELQSVLDGAEDAVATRVGPLAPTALTARISGGYTILRLPAYPVISVESVTPSDESVLDIADLRYDDSGILTYLIGSRFFTAPAYDVAYTAGRTTCPNDLKVAAMELVRHLWQSQRASGRSGPAQSTEMANTVPGAAYLFPFRIEQLLAPYVSPKVS